MENPVQLRARLAALLLPLLAAGALSPPAAAQRPGRFAQAELFLELNDTDGDLGLHAAIDGETWTQLTIEAPDERTMLQVGTRGRLRAHGMTELQFESAEPSFDELSPEEVLRRFPEGKYEIEARLQEGGAIESHAVLSHVLAAPPGNIRVSGIPAAGSCDAPVLPVVTAPVTIDWDPVTAHHPEIGRPGAVRIARYQLFVERGEAKLSLDLPPSITEFEIPAAITGAGGEFKFEIIGRTATGNNTAVESCFIVR
jgi:hypothetical protein